MDPHIKFIKELPGTDGLSFLDTLTKPTGNSIESTVYRKPTHTDRYLDYKSSPSFQQNYVIHNLIHRAKQVCSMYRWIKSMKNVCSKHGVHVHYEGGKTIKNLLMAPKSKDHITKKSGIIYRFKCNKVECDDEYIVESSTTFGERLREHLKGPPWYMTITASQVIVPPLKVSVLLGGRIRTSSELSRKQYT